MRGSKLHLIILLTAISLLAIPGEQCFGQVYIHSGGIRAGYSSGLAYKGFFENNSAAEIDALFNRHGTFFSLQYQYHIAPFRKDRYLFYIGGGAFSGRWEQSFSIGISGVTGFEYVMRDLPLVFSIDWRPMLAFLPGTQFDLIDFGISVRYHFEI